MNEPMCMRYYVPSAWPKVSTASKAAAPPPPAPAPPARPAPKVIVAPADDTLARAKKGDQKAMRQVLEQMAPLVRIIAGDWKRHADREDLIQEGTIGVWEAVQSWDPEHPKEVNFTAFCRIHIRGRISRKAAYDVSMVKLNRAEQEVFRGRDAAAREARAHRLCGDVSVDAPTRGTDQPAPSMVTALPSASLDPEALLAEAEEHHVRREVLDDLLTRLSPAEAAVLKARYLSDEPAPTTALAQRLQCHKEQVRQAGLRALTKLKGQTGGDWDTAEMASTGASERVGPKVLPRPGVCLYCEQQSMTDRKVCEQHQWRQAPCVICGGRVPYNDQGGRQQTICGEECVAVSVARRQRSKSGRLPLTRAFPTAFEKYLAKLLLAPGAARKTAEEVGALAGLDAAQVEQLAKVRRFLAAYRLVVRLEPMLLEPGDLPSWPVEPGVQPRGPRRRPVSSVLVIPEALYARLRDVARILGPKEAERRLGMGRGRGALVRCFATAQMGSHLLVRVENNLDALEKELAAGLLSPLPNMGAAVPGEPMHQATLQRLQGVAKEEGQSHLARRLGLSRSTVQRAVYGMKLRRPALESIEKAMAETKPKPADGSNQ